MNCLECTHFSNAHPVTGEDAPHCRRFPPSPTHGFPLVSQAYWCGEFEANLTMLASLTKEEVLAKVQEWYDDDT